MTKQQPDVYNKRSKRYVSELCIIAVFYSIPVGQLVYNHQVVSRVTLHTGPLINPDINTDDDDYWRPGHVLLQLGVRLSLSADFKFHGFQSFLLQHRIRHIGFHLLVHYETQGLLPRADSAEFFRQRGIHLLVIQSAFLMMTSAYSAESLLITDCSTPWAEL